MGNNPTLITSKLSQGLGQGSYLNVLKMWYKNHLNIPVLNKIVKTLLRIAVNGLASVKRMSFPKKYDWDWKLEMLTQKYEKETTALVKQIIKPGMTIIDIGSHIGYYTRLFSKLAGKNGVVYAFEPEDENFQLLQKNTRSFKNVKIIKKALSDRDGSIDFYKAQNNTGLHSVLMADCRQIKTTIPSQTLDGFIKENNINGVDLIKIDIEGGEPFALAGAKDLLSRKSPFIIMEFTPSNFSISKIRPLEFLESLEKLGFTIYKIKNNGELETMRLEIFNTDSIMEGKESINLFLKK